MPIGEKNTVDFDKLIKDEYKHIEDKIVKKTVSCTKKDIAILKSLLARNGAGVTALPYKKNMNIKMLVKERDGIIYFATLMNIFVNPLNTTAQPNTNQ